MGYSSIPNDASGRILITNIGFNNQPKDQALVCRSNTTNTTGSQFYLHPSMQSTNPSDRVQSTDPRGWRRNKDPPNGIIRLRRDSATTNWTEGVVTCIFQGINDPPISTRVYYPSESHSAIQYVYISGP